MQEGWKSDGLFCRVRERTLPVDWPYPSSAAVLVLMIRQCLYFQYVFLLDQIDEKTLYLLQEGLCHKEQRQRQQRTTAVTYNYLCLINLKKDDKQYPLGDGIMKYFPTQSASGLNYFYYNTVMFHPQSFPTVLFSLQEKVRCQTQTWMFWINKILHSQIFHNSTTIQMLWHLMR